MNFIKDYVEYLKDNPQGYWFKRKLYGWGWVPVKWQGWLVLFIWIIFFSYAVVTMKHEQLEMAVLIILAIGLLFYICYKKGEKPKWQWGIKKDK